MFAVLKTGGKQYTVRSGDVLRVERLACEAGETIQFNDVLMVGDQIGVPFVAGAAVQATVIDQIKGEKTIHFVRRRRKHSSKRTKGHRQQLTLVRVTDILEAGADATGVKVAVGSGLRSPAPTGLHAVGAEAVAAAQGVAERAGTIAETAVERVHTVVEAAAERSETLLERVGDTVVEAAEDVTSITAGKVALAAAAAGVAAIAAVVLGGTSADADDAADEGAANNDAAGEAGSKE